MKKLHEILKRPVLTEKSNVLKEKENKICFEVDSKSTKDEIKKAVETLFKVTVASVNTTLVHGKLKRVGRHLGRRSNWKKAVVTLKEGQTVELVEGV